MNGPPFVKQLNNKWGALLYLKENQRFIGSISNSTHGSGSNLSVTISLITAFCFADQLSHRSHRTVDTPASGFEQYHGNESKYSRGQHDTVKTEGKLSNTGMQQRAVISPLPWKFKHPQKCYHLLQVLCTSEYQIGIPEHQKKHGEKEDKKSVAKTFALHPVGDILFPRQSKSATQQAKELSTAAIAVAVAFCSAYNRNNQRDEEA